MKISMEKGRPARHKNLSLRWAFLVSPTLDSRTIMINNRILSNNTK